MTDAQMWVATWVQFVIAGTVLLFAGRLAWRWVPQPVERIRVMQMTLAATLVVPFALALEPLPVWRLGFLPPEPASIVERAPSHHTISAPASPLLAGAPETSESADVVLPDQNSLTERPTAEPSSSASIAAIAATPTDADTTAAINPRLSFWTVAAFSIAAVHLLALFVFLLEWSLGRVRLRRLLQGATDVSADVRALWQSISGAKGERVRLVTSSLVDSPLTFGWLRPVVVIPQELADSCNPSLEYCLSHEWSHVERHDFATWQGLWLCQFLHWYQPLFWAMRRELRLCQDLIADHRSSRAGDDALEYSKLLLNFARQQQQESLAGALTFVDHASHLTLRIKMLLERPVSLRTGCTWKFSICAGIAAIVSIGLLSSVRLDAAPGNDAVPTVQLAAAPQKDAPAKEDKPATKEQPQKPAETPADKGERLTYQCRVVEKETGKGIAGARVVVRRSNLTPRDNTPIAESRHTTDAEGNYTVEIPPEQVAERYLYIELDVEHDEFAGKKGFGYALSMIRKNEKLGERPFFEKTELHPAEPVTGKVVSPDGKPLAGIKVQGFSMEGSRNFRGYFSFTDTTTAADGTFRLNLVKGGDGIMWVIPGEYAIVQKFVGKKRGDVGEFQLQPGVRVTGRVLSAEGKPLGGVAVNIDFAGENDTGGLPVASSIRRAAISDVDGTFAFHPLAAGDYRVQPSEHLSDPIERDRTTYPLPGVFVARKISIKEGSAPIEIQAVPHVVFNAQIVDSQGKKTSGHSFSMFGQFDGQFWHAMSRPNPEGTVALRVPHGLEKVRVSLSTNEHGALRYRRAKGEKLESEVRDIEFGTLNEDVEGFEIVRYRAPLVLISAVDEEQKPIKGFKVTATYPWGKQRYVLEGEKRSDLSFEHQDDGRYRTSQMLPDEEVTFTATADGFESASEKVILPEGEMKELTLVLKKTTAAKTP